MPDNVLQVGPQLFSVLAGTIVFLSLALVFAFKYHATSSRAGEKGHRPDAQAKEGERVSPDGFIDSFAGVVSEAGGGLPFTAVVIMIATLVCYVVYLFLYWK